MFISCFISQLVTMARAGLMRSQEPGTCFRSSMWAGAQRHSSSSNAFPDTLAERQVRIVAAGTYTHLRCWCCTCRLSLNTWAPWSSLISTDHIVLKISTFTIRKIIKMEGLFYLLDFATLTFWTLFEIGALKKIPSIMTYRIYTHSWKSTISMYECVCLPIYLHMPDVLGYCN